MHSICWHFRTCVASNRLARSQFESVLNRFGYESPLAVGELQLQSGDSSGAISTLEKAFDLNGASWRTHLLLLRLARAGRRKSGEACAARRQSRQGKGAYPTFLLGKIQEAEESRRKPRPPEFLWRISK